MKRRVFNILAAVSLVLALAVAVLWARSSTRLDEFTIDGRLHIPHLELTSGRGRMGLFVDSDSFSDGIKITSLVPQMENWVGYFAVDGHIDYACRMYTWKSVTGASRGAVQGHILIIVAPHWLLVLLLLVLPAGKT